MREKVVQKVRELISDYLKANDVYLYDIEFVKEMDEDILRIYIDNETETVDLVTCVNISEGVSTLLDQDDPFPFPYSLEVSTPGAERELRNEKEIAKNVGKYIYFETKDACYYGTLLNYEGNVLDVEYMAKNIKKRVQVKYEDVVKIRKAIKF